MSLAQGNNTPTRPRIEPGSPDPESDALTIRPVGPDQRMRLLYLFNLYYWCTGFLFHHGNGHPGQSNNLLS